MQAPIESLPSVLEEHRLHHRDEVGVDADRGAGGDAVAWLDRAAEAELYEAARAGGLRSMREDGERLVQLGITSAEEVIRVTRE